MAKNPTKQRTTFAEIQKGVENAANERRMRFLQELNPDGAGTQPKKDPGKRSSKRQTKPR